MKKLDLTEVAEAIDELADLVRGGSIPDDQIYAEVAEKYEIQPQALRRLFLVRHPEGKVAANLPTMEDRVSDLVREALSKCNWPTLDRQIRFHGEVYTLICLVDAPPLVPVVYDAIRHVDGARVELSWQAVNKYLYETGQKIDS